MADATNTTPAEAGDSVPDEHAVRNEAHLKGLIAERDAAKQKLRAMEEKIEADKVKTLEEQNQFKALYEAEKAKASKVVELEQFKLGIETRQNEQIENLSKKLTGENQAEYLAYISMLSNEKKLDWLNQKLKEPVAAVNSVSAARPSGGSTKALSEMTFAEKAAFYKADPKGYEKASRA
jgi:hypothetical protein